MLYAMYEQLATDRSSKFRGKKDQERPHGIDHNWEVHRMRTLRCCCNRQGLTPFSFAFRADDPIRSIEGMSIGNVLAGLLTLAILIYCHSNQRCEVLLGFLTNF